MGKNITVCERLALGLIALAAIGQVSLLHAASYVTLHTPFGDVELELFDEETPATVANFMNYVQDEDYRNSFIHRSVPGFIIQGGGYVFEDAGVVSVPTDPAVVNEPGISNLRGTIAMAKRSGDPNSATSQWFINLADNSTILDDQNGGFTVFGRVLGDGMDVIDAIAGLTVWNAGAPFSQLPLIDYSGSGSITEEHLVMVDVSESESPVFPFNAGHSGAWVNPDTLGQGLLIDVEVEDGYIFLAWFSYSADQPGEQHWFTAQGQFADGLAQLTVYETLNGAFDDPRPVDTLPVGSAMLAFSDCNNGQMNYVLDHWGLEGTMPLQRGIPGSDGVCRQLAGISTQAVDINDGMDGAWYEPDTTGQGILLDVHPDPDGGNFVFAAWFTFGDDTASGQRWLTAQGGFQGSTADIEVYESTGGQFDTPGGVTTDPVGTLRIDFSDCSQAVLTYSLGEGETAGEIQAVRALPKGAALCEELAGQD